MASDIATGVIFALVLATVLCAIAIWPVLLYLTVHNVFSGSADDVRSTFLAVAALVGVPFLIWRTLISAKQTNISREAHYTALFTKAVEQLGAEKVVKRREFKAEYQKTADGNRVLSKDKKPIPLLTSDGEAVGEYSSYEITVKNAEVRLGAIYALERIAQDSQRDAWPIYQTLCSYIQNNAPPTQEIADRTAASNEADIDEIFRVLGRYNGPRNVAGGPIFFVSLHLEELWIREKSFRDFIFYSCSVYSISASKEIDNVHFQKCDIANLKFYDAVLANSGLSDGRTQKLSFHRAKAKNFEISATRIGELTCTEFRIENGIFDLSYSRFDASDSMFNDVHFVDLDQGALYMQRRDIIRANDFSDCEFRNCDLSFVELSSNLFNRCKFINCNLVEVGQINGSDNEFIDCMTADDVQIDRAGDALPELRQQWLAWKYGKQRQQ